jgi:hypothetical protein
MTQIACTDDTGGSFFQPVMAPFLRQDIGTEPTLWDQLFMQREKKSFQLQ